MKFFRLIIFFLLAGLCIGGVKFFFELKRSVFWDLQRVNLVVVSHQSNKTAIISFSDKKGKIFVLPEEKQVEVVRGFGLYKLGKVFALGELEKKGGLLLKETVQENFKIPVFGYIFEENLDFSRLKKNFWPVKKKNRQTDLSFEDLLILFIKTKFIPEFSTENFREDQLEDNFVDADIRDEAIPVEILNGTEHQGLAQKAFLQWENIGGRVVRVADSNLEGQPECKILFTDKVRESYSLKIMKEIYDCKSEQAGEIQQGRVDLSLTLGENYWKKIREKW